MLILVLVALVVLLAAAVAAFAAGFFRMSRNVGPLDLEDYGRRNHVAFIPVSQKLVEDLSQGWSQPLRLKLDNHAHPLLVTMTCTTTLKDEPESA